MTTPLLSLSHSPPVTLTVTTGTYAVCHSQQRMLSLACYLYQIDDPSPRVFIRHDAYGLVVTQAYELMSFVMVK